MKKSKVDWARYEEGLKKRGSITFWVSDDVISRWEGKPNGQKGRDESFSNLAIEACLMLRLIFKQPLRQTEGLVLSLFELMGLSLLVPDHTTLSRRGKNLDVNDPALSQPSGPITVALDSTGLKIYGAGEWCETKHGLSRKKDWRKLHLALNGDTIEIIASSLTSRSVGDLTKGIEQILNLEHPLDEVLADGAYDSEKMYKAANSQGASGKAKVTIPPPKNAAYSKDSSNPQRDEHVDFIKSKGRKAWENKEEYYRRLLAENAMGRYKGIIGAKLRARDEENQKTEASIGCKILNIMARLGTPLRPNLAEI